MSAPPSGALAVVGFLRAAAAKRAARSTGGRGLLAAVVAVLAADRVVGVPAEGALAASPGAHVEPAAVVVAVVLVAAVVTVMVAFVCERFASKISFV